MINLSLFGIRTAVAGMLINRCASVLTVVFLVTSLMFLGCAKESASPKRTTVILVSIDTLRADALSAFGYPHPTTPNMDRFLAESVTFTNAYTPEPHTLPSHVSLLTSLHPLSHGVEARLSGGRPLASHIPTLATMLKDHGYSTAAFINGGFLHPRFGLTRGFDHYDYFSDHQQNEENATSLHGRSAHETNRSVMKWLDGRVDPYNPLFLLVHYFDVHSDWNVLPYDSPPTYRAQFTRGDPTEFESGRLGKGSMFLAQLNQRDVEIQADTIDYIRSLYDAGVRYTDDQFGALMQEFQDRKIYDDAMIVLVTDHGEAFMEHAKTMHEQLYEHCTRAVLGIKFPVDEGIVPIQIDGIVRLMDVMPTILDYLDVSMHVQMMQGRSLMPQIRGAVVGDTKPIYLFASVNGQMAMIDDGWKVILDPPAGSSELYHLRDDPGEQNNLAASESVRLAHLARELTQWAKHVPRHHRDTDAERVNLDAKTIRGLKSLGYVK